MREGGGNMVDAPESAAGDREAEIAVLTFECRLAVEAAVTGTRRLETLPTEPALKAELAGIVKLLEQIADAFEDLHGALQRFTQPFEAAQMESDETKSGAKDHPALPACARDADFTYRFGNERHLVQDAAIWAEGRSIVQRILDTDIRAKPFSRNDLQDLFEVREVFEPIACGLASKAMSDEEIDWLARSLEQSLRVPDLGARSDRHNDFHLHIIVGSKNASLIDMLCDNLYYKIQFFSDHFSLPENWLQMALPGRRAIVEALRARDTALAASEMKRHLAFTRASTAWLGAPEPSRKVEDLAAYRRYKRKWTQ
jgi:DNA-binding GntR family transcriptional regulator